MSLKTKLGEEKVENLKKIPRLLKKYLENQDRALENSGLAAGALSVGDKMPDAKLLAFSGQEITFSEITRGKAVIVSFYRGVWCPYCNLELREYDRVIKDHAELDINMIAISPEKPDAAEDSGKLESLDIKVFSDIDNKLARKARLVFKLPFFLNLIYKLGGANLNKSQGNAERELPIPATYIIDERGVITYAFLNTDYTKRAEPTEVIAEYLKLVG